MWNFVIIACLIDGSLGRFVPFVFGHGSSDPPTGQPDGFPPPNKVYPSAGVVTLGGTGSVSTADASPNSVWTGDLTQNMASIQLLNQVSGGGSISVPWTIENKGIDYETQKQSGTVSDARLTNGGDVSNVLSNSFGNPGNTVDIASTVSKNTTEPGTTIESGNHVSSSQSGQTVSVSRVVESVLADLLFSDVSNIEAPDMILT